MSENAIGYLLDRAGYHRRHVPHGWRATFSTLMNERHRADRQVIDPMLAHAPKDKVEGGLQPRRPPRAPVRAGAGVGRPAIGGHAAG